MTVLRGAKGSSLPAETSDTLRSTQRAEIVDLLGEGQIGGLVNGLKSIYLDGVPVENADGSRNFAEFGYTLTLGGPTGAQPHSFDDVQTEVGVGVTVLAAVPVVRTIADATADAVRVTITVPQLVQVKDTGERVGAAFEYAIDVQSNGGGYVERYRDTVSGKASSPYSRAVRIALANLGPAPWDVRVRRITADSASVNLVDAFAWTSYTVISGVRMLYKNSAVARVTFDAKNFQAVPSRAYDLMGISDWDIPVNYDPLARTVTGVWNGLFKQGWTNNPAWVLYNLIQHRRYGLGEYVAQLPDKWTLYQLAQWCDGMLPDGRGGQEPRYTINAYIQEQSEALRLLQDICSVFRGALLHAGSTFSASWDAPATPTASYVPANVVDGLFTYSEGSAGAKKTSCTCWYTDRTQAGKRVPATWDDGDLVARYGLRSMEISPLGVATPGQALRMAKWALYTQHYEDSTVTFRIGAEGQVRRIGEVFQVTDPAETGERLGGRIHSATTTVVQLDGAVDLAAGETYTLWVTLPHPTDPTRLVQEQRAVTTGAGTVTALQVSPAFSQAPSAQTVWLLEGSTVAPTLWRYVAINEVKGEGGRIEYEVTGLAYEPGKWDLVERNQPLSPRPTRRLATGAKAVAVVTITETIYFDGPDSRIRASVSWPFPAAGLRYVVAWRLDNGPWTTLQPTSGNTVDLDALQPGVLEVQVQSLNGLGQLSIPVSQTLTLAGDQSFPDNVAGLAFEIVASGVRLSWTPDTKPGYDKTRLSYGATFAASTFFWEGNSSDFVVRPPADGTYLVWAVHVNKRGRASQVPHSIEVIYTAAGAGTNGLNNATVFLFQRAATAPAVPSAAVTYTFATGGVTGLTNGWLAGVPTGTLPLWVIKAVASATTPTDSIGSGEWSAPAILAQDGVAGASAPKVDLSASTQVFVTPPNGSTPAPASSVLTATVANITGATYVWRLDGVVQSGATGATFTLPSFAAGTQKLVRVDVSGTGGAAFDQMTVYSVREGSDSLAAGLDNENQTVACDAFGNPSPAGQFPLTAQAYAVRGSSFLSSGVTYGIQAGSNSGFSSPSISATGAVSIAGMVANTAQVIFTATVGGVTIPMRFNASKALAGQQGTQGNPGTAGTAGVSARRAYALYTGNPTVFGSAVQTVGASSLPASNAWSPGAATSFTSTVQTPGSGQSLMQTDGLYDPATGLTTWQVPYLSNFKVGSISALATDFGTMTAGTITGTASINITGSARFDGVNSALSIEDPFSSPSNISRTIATIVNSGGAAAIGLYALSSTAGSWAVYGKNSSTSANSAGVMGFGLNGVIGVALPSTANSVGVYGQAGTASGSAGVKGQNSLAGTWAVQAINQFGGAALNVQGTSTFTGTITSTFSAGPSLVLPVISFKPTAVNGGFALHSTYGPIFSNGAGWFAAASLIALP